MCYCTNDKRLMSDSDFFIHEKTILMIKSLSKSSTGEKERASNPHFILRPLILTRGGFWFNECPLFNCGFFYLH